MIEKIIIIKSANGLHARPAGIFAKKATEFQSAITVKSAKGSANAKSIMSIMSLGIDQGAEITIVADGTDETVAINELSKILEA